MLAALTVSAQTTPNRPKYHYVSANAATLALAQLEQPTSTLLRTLYAGYNTVCLPFSLTADEVTAMLGEGVTVEKAIGATLDGQAFTLCLEDCTAEGIEAGMPYIVYSPRTTFARIQNTTGAPVLAQPLAVTLGDGEGNVATFRGSFEQLKPVGSWAIPAVEGEIPAELIRCTGERLLNPTRCFFTWDHQGSASSMALRHVTAGELITGLHAATVQHANGETYNLAGQRIATPQNGVNIQSGKKMIKK